MFMCVYVGVKMNGSILPGGSAFLCVPLKVDGVGKSGFGLPHFEQSRKLKANTVDPGEPLHIDNQDRYYVSLGDCRVTSTGSETISGEGIAIPLWRRLDGAPPKPNAKTARSCQECIHTSFFYIWGGGRMRMHTARC